MNNRLIKAKSLLKKGIIISLFIGIFSFVFIAYYLYFYPNISIKDEKSEYLYIYESDKFNDILFKLEEKKILKNKRTIKILSIFEDYENTITPGCYLLKDGMSNLKLLRMIEKGQQTPIKITFNNIRTKQQLSKRLSEQLMIDSAQIIQLLNDDLILQKYGLNTENAVSIFIPNTYEVYWTIKPKDLLDRMKKEYDVYWNEDRKQKAKDMGFSPTDISTLASIVEEETNKKKEKSTVAGLYINRLRKGIPLQADPTIKFALGDFSVKRILREFLTIDSPYNTYLYAGLPPGPIRLPSIETIDAVLNYEKHEYIYMCAKEDLSGYHNFATSYDEHQRNAVKYRRALNKLKIYK